MADCLSRAQVGSVHMALIVDSWWQISGGMLASRLSGLQQQDCVWRMEPSRTAVPLSSVTSPRIK